MEIIDLLDDGRKIQKGPGGDPAPVRLCGDGGDHHRQVGRQQHNIEP